MGPENPCCRFEKAAGPFKLVKEDSDGYGRVECIDVKTPECVLSRPTVTKRTAHDPLDLARGNRNKPPSLRGQLRAKDPCAKSPHCTISVPDYCKRTEDGAGSARKIFPFPVNYISMYVCTYPLEGFVLV